MKHAKRAPLWQWLLVILLAVALPLFYTFIGDVQIEQTVASENQQQANQKQHQGAPHAR